MKKPMLAIGILFMILFILDLNKRGVISYYKASVQATSCKSVLVMLNKRVPASWDNRCEGNNLAISITSSIDESKVKPEFLKNAIYRELANDLTFVAKNSMNESLDRVFIVRIQLEGKSFEINAVTEGKHLSKLATITNTKFIMDHLKETVAIKENFK